jgi:hypothetical protein
MPDSKGGSVVGIDPQCGRKPVPSLAEYLTVQGAARKVQNSALVVNLWKNAKLQALRSATTVAPGLYPVRAWREISPDTVSSKTDF